METVNNASVSPNVEWLAGLEDTGDYFNCSHRVITSFIELLQNEFCRKTNYSRPLISPQGNIFFAIDNVVACEMIAFIAQQLEQVAGFAHDDYCFTHKSGHDGSGLQRIRLEFRDGVTRNALARINAATGIIKRAGE